MSMKASNPTTTTDLLAQDREVLLSMAYDAIGYHLANGRPSQIDVSRYSPALQQVRATFVTLEIQEKLRGCIGTLEAVRPLVADVAHNACSAAFHDPRFPPLRIDEHMVVSIHISILSPAEPMSFTGEADLLQQIVPGVDGLILQDGPNRGTFLPSVWQHVPDKDQFLAHLKQKAGLAADYWSDSIKVSRYRTESVS
jgi:AmmeMemoRadiSam system protein A